MTNADRALTFSAREENREIQFDQVWREELNDVFADVAGYYDTANRIASLGMWDWLCRRFISTIDVQSGQMVLDVCAGTNAVGIALLKKQPDLKLHAIDRSRHMQEAGRQTAEKLGMHIDSTIGDVRKLPFPDNHFDVVTLQYASRHLPVMAVFSEIERVLKPGGCFYHADMLRPANRIVEQGYYLYLRFFLHLTAVLLGSSESSHRCKRYFIDALRMFYSVDEISDMLRTVGFEQVSSLPLLAGTIGYHRAVKAATAAADAISA